MSKAFTKESDTQADDDEGPALPPIPAGSRNYMTPAGYARLRGELLDLIDNERPKIVEVVHWAASNGDRSENGDYLYGKKRLREIDRRVRFLTKRLEALTVVEPSAEQHGAVRFGAWVTVEDEEGEQQTYRIVGPDEFDVKERKISVDSPLARALLGKEEDDVVMVNRPKGEVELTILEIRYQ